MDGCKFQGCGQIPRSGDAPANYANLLIMGQGSVATVTNTTFTDVQFAGVLVADQAHATLKDITIQGGQYGIDLGVSATNLPKGGSADLENVTLSGQTGQAARLTRAGQCTRPRMVMQAAASSTPRKPPPFSAMAKRALAT